MLPAALLLSLATGLAAEAPRGKDTDSPRADGLKALAGEWFLASTSDENRTTPGNQHLRMVVGECGRVRFLLDGSETNSGTFALARGRGKLRPIDLRLAAGKVLRGVYAFEGGALVICFAEQGKPRPDRLTPRGDQWAERWERPLRRKKPATCVKPSDEADEGGS